jgi:hypothetical protein
MDRSKNGAMHNSLGLIDQLPILETARWPYLLLADNSGKGGGDE